MNYKKVSLPFNISCLLLLSILIVMADCYTYFFDCQYKIALFLGLITTLTVFLLIRKHIKIIYEYQKEDIIFLVLLGIIFIMHIPMADEMYDTINYHLYLQERPFVSKLVLDFFPGRYINSFSYAFGDRMFYIFRYFLGYRLGVILNYFVIIILYYQLKEIFKSVIRSNTRLIFIFSLITVFSLSILEQIDNYYVDLLSLVFLLELARQALRKKQENSFFWQNIIFLLVAGFAIAIKISNGFFVIIFSLVYLKRNWENMHLIKWKDILIYILIFSFPFLVYFVYTWIETGNPFFPFYNTIFRSPYYPNTNWVDTRFGPYTFLEFILWPIYAVFFPERTADTHICEPVWAIAYMATIFYLLDTLVHIIFKKKGRNNVSISFLALITLVLYLVWAKCLLGYTRYAIIVVIFGTITILLILYDLFKNKRYIIFTIFFAGMLWNVGYSSYQYLYSNKSLFYDNIFQNTKSNYIYNVKHLFDSNQKIISFPESSAWGVIAENSGDCIMINNTLPILNLTWGAATEKSEELLEQNLKKYDHIYATVNYTQLDYFLKRLNEYYWKIKGYYATVIPAHTEEYGSYYIFEIEKGSADNSKLESINEFVFSTDISNRLSGYIGLHPSIRTFDPCIFNIYGIVDDHEILLQTVTIEAEKLYFINIETEGYSQIKVKASTSNDEKVHMIFLNNKGGI